MKSLRFLLLLIFNLLKMFKCSDSIGFNKVWQININTQTRYNSLTMFPMIVDVLEKNYHIKVENFFDISVEPLQIINQNNTKNSMKFNMEIYDYGFIGINIGGYLTETDIINIEIDRNYNANITDLYAQSHSTILNDLKIGGELNVYNITQNINFTNNKKTLSLSFIRDYETEDKIIDFQWMKTDQAIVIFTFYGRQIKTDYQNYEDVLHNIFFCDLNQTECYFTTLFNDDAGNYDPYFNFFETEHAFNGISFIELNSVWISFLTTIILVRIFKQYKLVIILHIIVFCIAYFFILNEIIFLFWTEGDGSFLETDTFSINFHVFISFIVFASLIVMVINSIFLFIFNYILGKNIVFLKVFHAYFGIFTSLCYVTSCVVINLNTSNIVTFPIISRLFCILHVFLTLIQLILFSVDLYKDSIGYTKIEQLRLELHKNAKNLGFKEFEQLYSKNYSKNFVIYENLIIDIGNYSINHPGGKSILENYYRKSIDSFLSGTYSGLSGVTANRHSYKAISYLLSLEIIGKINYENQNISFYDRNTTFDDGNKLLERKYLEIDSTFTCIKKSVSKYLKAKRSIKVDFSIFNTDNSTLNIKFSKYLSGTNHFSKHFSLYSFDLNKTRYYTFCQGLNSEVNEYFNELITRILKNSKISQKDYLPPFENEHNNELSLYLRECENKDSMGFELSRLDDIENDSSYKINGPVGLGLGIYDHTILNGPIVLMSAGTGIISFIDFILFIFRYSLFILYGRQTRIETKYKEFYNIMPGFKLILFSSFKKIEESIFHEFCLKFSEFDKENNLNIFSYVPRFSDSSSEKFNHEKIKNILTYNIDDLSLIQKVMISGPENFLNEIKESYDLLKLKEKVFEV